MSKHLRRCRDIPTDTDLLLCIIRYIIHLSRISYEIVASSFFVPEHKSCVRFTNNYNEAWRCSKMIIDDNSYSIDKWQIDILFVVLRLNNYENPKNNSSVVKVRLRAKQIQQNYNPESSMSSMLQSVTLNIVLCLIMTVLLQHLPVPHSTYPQRVWYVCGRRLLRRVQRVTIVQRPPRNYN